MCACVCVSGVVVVVVVVVVCVCVREGVRYGYITKFLHSNQKY